MTAESKPNGFQISQAHQERMRMYHENDCRRMRGTSGMRIAMALSVGLAIASGTSGCSALPGANGGDGSLLSLFPSIGGDGNGKSGEAGKKQSGTSHNATDNDKLAYYKSQSPDGRHEITSVLFLQRSDGDAITYDNLSASLSQAGVDWYQAIIDKSTGDTNTKEGAHLYLPSGLSYDQITNVASTLTKAGYVCDLLTPDEYDEYVNQQYSIYRVQTTYMGPASDNK